MMYIHLFLLSVVLLLVAWLLHLSKTHKRQSSELIRRLEDHHEHSRINTSMLQEQAKQSLQLSDEILQFIKDMQRREQASDEDIREFTRTNQFKP